MYKVVLVVLLVVITLICVSGQSLQSLDESHVEKGRDMKLRHGKRKGVVGAKGKGSGGKQLRLSQDIDAANGNYGTALPAFAFDYSEYLAGAVIERSSRSDNLYLTMFLVGHRTIDHDWPFEMVSTDEEVIYSWGNAARKWNVTSTQNNHRLTNADDNTPLEVPKYEKFTSPSIPTIKPTITIPNTHIVFHDVLSPKIKYVNITLNTIDNDLATL